MVVNKHQYKLLCEKFDWLLTQPTAGIARVAISTLHVVRAHPIFFAQYECIFKKCFARHIIFQIFRNVASAFSHLIRSFFFGSKSKIELGQTINVLLISHLLSEADFSKKDDFYYGDLAVKLRNHGISSLTTYIDYTKTKLLDLNAKKIDRDDFRLIYPKVLSIKEELIIYTQAAIDFLRILKHNFFTKSCLDRRIAIYAAVHALSGATISALRLAYSIKKVVKSTRPDIIVVTYEGHSWERIAFFSARSVDSNILCVGYQHATLLNMQHSLARGLDKKFNPDLILTSGEIALDKLKKIIQFPVEINLMGSKRSFLKSNHTKPLSSIDLKVTCLVVPEGITSEVILLFNFSLMCAQLLPEVNFIWRLHPNMLDVSLEKLSSNFIKLPSNVVLSNNDINEDLINSDFALYRGSTSVVQGVVNGVRPIYLEVENEISIDPLHEVCSYRDSVSNVFEFKKIIQDRSGNVQIKQENFLFLQNFCEKIYTPLNPECFIKIIKEHNARIRG